MSNSNYRNTRKPMNTDNDFGCIKVEVRRKFRHTLSNWLELREVRKEQAFKKKET